MNRLDRCTRVETKGSVWFLDDGDGQYLRLPLGEGPRERAEWSDERAGVLEDAVWHPMVGWVLGPHPLHDEDGRCRFGVLCRSCPGLMISYVDSSGELERSWAPGARVVRAAA